MKNTIIRSDRIRCKIAYGDGDNPNVSVKVDVVDRTKFLDAISKFMIYASTFEMDSYIWTLDDVDKVELAVERIKSFIEQEPNIPYSLDGVSNELYKEIRDIRVDLNDDLEKSFDGLTTLGFYASDLDKLPNMMVQLEMMKENQEDVKAGATYLAFIAVDCYALIKKAFDCFDLWASGSSYT